MAERTLNLASQHSFIFSHLLLVFQGRPGNLAHAMEELIGQFSLQRVGMEVRVRVRVRVGSVEKWDESGGWE